MDPKALIHQSLRLSRQVTTMLLSDLEDEDLLMVPTKGYNPIALQLGHLISAEKSMMKAIRPDSHPDLPEGFEAKHSPKSEDKESKEGYLTKDEYLKLYEQQREATRKLLDEVPVEELSKPTTGDFQQIAPTIGDLFMAAASHELMHSGQYSIVRRMLNKPQAM